MLQSIGRTILTIALRSALQPSRDALRSGFAGLFGGEGAVTPIARGGIVSRGRAAPFASGGVVSAPTYFPLGRSLGRMGERGAEAAMPLVRGPDGRLGVRTAAGGRPVAVTVSIQASEVESFRCSESEVTASVARAVARGQRAL